jgi:hypothetical protein
MKHLVSLGIIAVIIILGSLIGCDKEDSKPELPEISVIDIGDESGWDYLVLGKEDYYFIKGRNSYPEGVLFYSSEADKEYSIFFTQNGLIDKVVVDGYICVFRNFNGYKVDIGLVSPDGKVEIFRELETDYNWDSLSLKNANAIEEWSDVVRWTGRVVSGVPCGLSVVAAVKTGGLATPLAYWTCSNYLLSTSVDIATNEFEVHNGFTDFVETYGDATTAISCSSGDLQGCGFDIASRSLSEWANHLEIVENSKRDDVHTAESVLEHGYGDVQITLTWNNTSDLDLHVIDPFGEEIYWGNESSSSGGTLDVDNIEGYGPENIFWAKGKAPNGVYKVFVHHYDWRGYATKPLTSNFTVLINAFDKILNKKYIGTVTVDQEKSIANFDQNGLKSALLFEFEITTGEDKKTHLKLK